MKTIEQVIEQYKSDTLDGRDLTRLSVFLPEEALEQFGIVLKKEYIGKHVPIPFTKENILIQLEKDVAFGFEKALNMRGISSSLMFDVVRMWNWILEEGLENWNDTNRDQYENYGLPLFKATAVKYGFNNPIGNNTGSEDKYDEDWEGEYDEED